MTDAPPAEAQTPAAPKTPPAQDSGDRPDSVAEAKKYRQRAQAAEQERDALRDRLEKSTREAVESRIRLNTNRIAGQGMYDAADLFTIGGVALSDLTDDDGNPDDAKIRDAIDGLREARPYLFVQDQLHAVLGAHSGGGVPPEGMGNAWTKALQNAKNS